MKVRKVSRIHKEYTLCWAHDLDDHSNTTYNSVVDPLTHISKLDTTVVKATRGLCGYYKIYKNLEIGLSILFTCLFLLNSISFEHENINK